MVLPILSCPCSVFIYGICSSGVAFELDYCLAGDGLRKTALS
jgi:hypothetical protein